MAGVLRKKIFGFQYLSLKLSLTLPHKEKMLWCSYYRSFIKSIKLDRCGNFIEKFNFISTPSKIIIPIAHHPPYHPLNMPSPTSPPNLPPPPTTSLTSTPPTPPPLPNHHPPHHPKPHHPHPTQSHPTTPNPTIHLTTPTIPMEKKEVLNA